MPRFHVAWYLPQPPAQGAARVRVHVHVHVHMRSNESQATIHICVCIPWYRAVDQRQATPNRSAVACNRSTYTYACTYAYAHAYAGRRGVDARRISAGDRIPPDLHAELGRGRCARCRLRPRSQPRSRPRPRPGPRFHLRRAEVLAFLDALLRRMAGAWSDRVGGPLAPGARAPSYCSYRAHCTALTVLCH